MTGQLFDVFVVGSADPSPAGETRLASALSSKHGVPLTTVAKAISAKNLRAGQSLEQSQAQALVRQLQVMGAVTVIRPAAGPSRAPSPAASPAGLGPAAPMPPAVTMSRGDRQAYPAAPDSAPSALAAAAPGFGPPLVAPSGSAAAGGPFAPLQSGSAAGSQGGSFASPPGAPASSLVAPRLGGGAQLSPPPAGSPSGRLRATRTPPPASQHGSPVPGTDAFSADVSSGPRLELARGDPTRSSDDAIPARATPTVGSLRDIGATKSSGVAMDEDPRNLDLVRCAQHGLYYDKTKASGCRKCMSMAREVAMAFESRSAPASLKLANLRDQPAKRAFIGLAVAFVLGLLPAAYYAFGPGSADARELRVRQEVLSRQPGTEEILRQFDELDEQVSRSRDRSARNIALVWAATSMAGMAGWYKVT